MIAALDDAGLVSLARDRRTEYAQAEPFQHAVLDGLFDPAALERVAEEFPPPDDSRWTTYTDASEAGKQELSDPAMWGPSVRELVSELSSPAWLRFVEELTGLDALSRRPARRGHAPERPRGPPRRARRLQPAPDLAARATRERPRLPQPRLDGGGRRRARALDRDRAGAVDPAAVQPVRRLHGLAALLPRPPGTGGRRTSPPLDRPLLLRPPRRGAARAHSTIWR